MNHELDMPLIKTVALDELPGFVDTFLSRLRPMHDTATVVRLVGDLGAGKTTFTGLLARRLGVIESVVSPTFVIQKSYPIVYDKFKHLIHVDAYRLESGNDLEKLRFREYLINPDNLIFIEWPEIVADILPDSGYEIRITHVDENTREFVCRMLTDL